MGTNFYPNWLQRYKFLFVNISLIVKKMSKKWLKRQKSTKNDVFFVNLQAKI